MVKYAENIRVIPLAAKIGSRPIQTANWTLYSSAVKAVYGEQGACDAYYIIDSAGISRDAAKLILKKCDGIISHGRRFVFGNKLEADIFAAVMSDFWAKISIQIYGME